MVWAHLHVVATTGTVPHGCFFGRCPRTFTAARDRLSMQVETSLRSLPCLYRLGAQSGVHSRCSALHVFSRCSPSRCDRGCKIQEPLWTLVRRPLLAAPPWVCGALLPYRLGRTTGEEGVLRNPISRQPFHSTALAGFPPPTGPPDFGRSSAEFRVPSSSQNPAHVEGAPHVHFGLRRKADQTPERSPIPRIAPAAGPRASAG